MILIVLGYIFIGLCLEQTSQVELKSEKFDTDISISLLTIIGWPLMFIAPIIMGMIGLIVSPFEKKKK